VHERTVHAVDAVPGDVHGGLQRPDRKRARVNNRNAQGTHDSGADNTESR
jgi:hypothetical protein